MGPLELQAAIAEVDMLRHMSEVLQMSITHLCAIHDELVPITDIKVASLPKEAFTRVIRELEARKAQIDAQSKGIFEGVGAEPAAPSGRPEPERKVPRRRTDRRK